MIVENDIAYICNAFLKQWLKSVLFLKHRLEEPFFIVVPSEYFIIKKNHLLTCNIQDSLKPNYDVIYL